MLAQRPDEPGRALTLEVVRSVDAPAAVETRVDGTLVTVNLATITNETRRTDTLVTADSVQARPTLLPT